MTGETIAHYKLTEKIGAGGMGDVYRATDLKLHRDVAVKLISPAFARDPERMARFEREALVLASLTHGAIAAVYGIEEYKGSKAIVMELVEGEDLSDRLKRGPLPLDEVLRTGIQIAEALEAAHDRGVIHRDLKPGNIKLLESGRVKLLDFGLAKALEESGPAHLAKGDAATLSVANTRAGVVLGTAAYMSPEQATGAPADKRSDVWSFGVVLFEMLTGKRLFDGQTTSHVLADVIRAEIDFARLPENTPAEFRTILERTLERDARRRLRDIHDARIVLERLLERGTGPHSAVRSGPATVVATQTAVSERAAPMRNAAALAIGGVIVGALLTAAFFWMRPAETDTRQLRLTARLAEAPFGNAPGPAFDLSADGTQIASIVDVGSDRRIQIRRLNELDSTTLLEVGADTQQRPYNLFFSPDGAWLGYALPGELRKVPTTGGTPLTICKVSRSRGASWGADGTIVLAPSPESGLMRVSAAGGEPQPLTTLNADAKEITHRWPQILPGGKAVLFTSHTAQNSFDEASIEVVRLDSGERHVVQKGGSYGRYVPSGHLVYVADGNLLAVPFDLGRLAVTGPAAPVVQSLTANRDHGFAQFAFAQSGLMLYLQGNRNPEFPTHSIVLVDRSGQSATLLDEPGTYAHPRISPDGRKLSLTVYKNRNWDIWVYDMERRVSTRLTFDDLIETEQVWSPDGRELLYTAEQTTGPKLLLRKAADGSGAPITVWTGEEVLWAQTWAPDGASLGVTASNAGTNLDIGILSLAGQKPELKWMLNSRFAESEPAISPDGRWVAYTSTESGASEIYIRRYPSGSGRWQVSNGGGGFARWSANGRELFYRTRDGVMVADIEAAGETLRTSTPRTLFKGTFAGGPDGMQIGSYVFADFDVMPNGRQFVMFPKPVDTQTAATGMLTVVLNWFDDLRRATRTQ